MLHSHMPPVAGACGAHRGARAGQRRSSPPVRQCVARPPAVQAVSVREAGGWRNCGECLRAAQHGAHAPACAEQPWACAPGPLLSLRRASSAARAQGADEAAGGVDPAFLRARVSQRFGADLSREAGAGAAGRTGDADVPRRAPLAEQRARFDAQARPQQTRSWDAPELYNWGTGSQWFSMLWVPVMSWLRCTLGYAPAGWVSDGGSDVR